MKETKYDPFAMHIQIAYIDAILEENRRNMRAIDSASKRRVLIHDRPIKAHKTLHDMAQDNEFLRLILRRSQGL